MKYLKRFTEELKSSTYFDASHKLSSMGHKRRSQELKNWAEISLNKEKLEELELKRKQLSKYPPFHLQFYKRRWSSVGTENKILEDFLVDGLFYINPTFYTTLFYDSLADCNYDHTMSLWLDIEMSTTPFDEETLMKWEKIKDQLSEEEYEGKFWCTKIEVGVIPEGLDSVVSNADCFWSTMNDDIFVFSSRSEAVRFKKLLIESIEGKNDWGGDFKNPGLKKNFDHFFSDSRVQEGYTRKFNKEDMPKLVNSIRNNLTINKIYRN